MICIVGDAQIYQEDPYWKDLVLFYEYFHGDTGRGCGARYMLVARFNERFINEK